MSEGQVEPRGNEQAKAAMSAGAPSHTIGLATEGDEKRVTRSVDHGLDEVDQGKKRGTTEAAMASSLHNSLLKESRSGGVP